MNAGKLAKFLATVDPSTEVLFGDFTTGTLFDMAAPKKTKSHRRNKDAELERENRSRKRRHEEPLSMREFTTLVKKGTIILPPATLNDVFTKETDEVEKIIVLSVSTPSTAKAKKTTKSRKPQKDIPVASAPATEAKPVVAAKGHSAK